MEERQQSSRHRSTSRSPSLSRRPSLKEKPGGNSGIVKQKKKGSKKERWLLTRKTWRYMSDAVGNLLPEHKTQSSSPTASSSRGPSSSVSSPVTPTPPTPPVHTSTFSTGIVPAGHSYTASQVQPWPLYSPLPPGGKRASIARSSICSGSGLVPLESDIPALEANFEKICRKEKKFLVWNRTKSKGLSGPALRELKMKEEMRRDSSDSSALRDDTPRQSEPKDLQLDYYSPEDEDLMDDYDDYEPDEERMTVREIPHRKSSSGASSVVSLVSGGLSFFRSQPQQQIRQTEASADSFYIVSHGVHKYFRNTGVQTDPFPDEILNRLKSVREEQGRAAEAVLKDPLDYEEQSEDTQKASLLESSVGDKKSEESGYASSISDTVMRYFRMVRKNSKSDAKEGIDRFKTVNYDRSLRNIKSKNVTVEEALEHEKKKAMKAQEKSEQPLGLTTEFNSSEPAQHEELHSDKEKPQTTKEFTTSTTKNILRKGAKKGRKPKDVTPGDTGPDSAIHSSPSECVSSPETPTSPISPPPTPPPAQILQSIGVQVGEPLINLLKNFNPFRKFSDLSSYGSSESPGDVTSPRYSIATGSDASEVYSQEGQQHHSRHYYGGDSYSGIEFDEMYSSPSRGSQCPSSMSSGSLKKSSSALQMKTPRALTLLPSSPYFHHPQDHHNDYSSNFGKFSSSTPTTPISTGQAQSRTAPSYPHPGYNTSSCSRSGGQFLSSFRGSKDQQYSSPTPTSSGSGGGGGFGESISSFISRRSVISSHRSKDSVPDLKENTTARKLPFDSSPLSSSLVMQKSKSSSSVFHSHASSGEKRGSTSSTGGGGITILGTSATGSSGGTGSGSSGGRLISKPKIFKSRSKSSTRAPPSCNWTPQGKCTWTSNTGRKVTLEGTSVLNMSEKELETLQQVALAKLQALNLGVEIKIPREKVLQNQKPKRRAYLLKKKALSTGFFESGAKEGEGVGGSGLVFGIPLSQCIQNDRDRASRGTTQPHPQKLRSENGSRNSVSSIYEGAKTASTESLFWGKRSGSIIGEMSSTAPDILGENIPAPRFVPSIVNSCVNFLETYGLHTTGIFRVSTSLKRIRQLREDIDRGTEIVFGEEHSPHDVAALLKEFLRDLPEPLLCTDLYNAFLKTQKIRNRRLQLEAVQHLIQLLPLPNRDTLAVILKLFSKVVENAFDRKTRTGEILNGNKMESYSLATLIAPNILPFIPAGGNIPSGDPNQTRERRESIDVVNYMIINYEDLFEISPELLDEVYVHLMDEHPEVVENIFKHKSGGGLDEPDEVESSSVFEGSEPGETWREEEASGGTKKFQRREDILHKEGGTGGSGRGETGGRRDVSKDRSGGDGEKQQSGGESDSSSTKSSNRWFRRSRADPKSRTSSDSGSEKTKGKRRDSSLGETKRASSLDSVNLKESGLLKTITAASDYSGERQRSSSDQNLKVPDALSRRQSSPVLESSGIITASLKIPVPLSIDDSDIPFIEEDNSEGHARDSGKLGRKDDGRKSPKGTRPVSPPGSPAYDPSTFPYEEMTARFLIGGPAQEPPPSSETTTVVTKSKLSQLPKMGTLTVLPVEDEPASPPSQATIQPDHLGKETKGAAIAGLIKSKTADFEKFAKDQNSPVSIPNLRLRSQGNIQLKQQFLLRQQQQQQAPTLPARSTSGILLSTGEQRQQKPLFRKKPVTASTTGQEQPSPSRWKRSEIIASKQSDGKTKELPPQKDN